MKRNYESGVVNWILIIIGILIVLTLVGYFTTDRSDNKKEAGTLTQLNKPDCGLVINRPVENSLVIFPVAVSGYLRACDSIPFNSEYGTVQVMDANGTPLGPETEIPIVGNWVSQDAHFSLFVPVSSKPQTAGGFLIFINHDKAGNTLNAFQIPVMFPTK